MTPLVEQLVPVRILTPLRRHAEGREVWLVGGALRDHFLGRRQPDLDFVVDREATDLARRLANDLSAGFYAMDETRDAARVMLPQQAGRLDFVRRVGPSIEADLRERDFTANALALSLDGRDRLVDPLGGLQDLKDRRLRACSPGAVAQDPLRALRAVRLATQLSLRMDPEAVRQVRSASARLSEISSERVRDEFMRILEPLNAGAGVRLLEHLGLLIALCPELDELAGPDAPGRERVLSTIDRLDEIVGWLGSTDEAGRGKSLIYAELSLRLGRFREGLSRALHRRLRGGRTTIQLLALAGLYAHPTGSNRHPDLTRAEQVHRRSLALRLSRPEAARIRSIVLRSRWPLRLTSSEGPSDGEIYRFFRASGEAGIPIVVLVLAASLAELGSAPPAATWRARIETARRLLEGWFERADRVVRPAKLIAGDELAAELGLESNWLIGELLEAIRQAQAEGKVGDRIAALELARNRMRGLDPASVKGKSR